jgi:hypothetical protein
MKLESTAKHTNYARLEKNVKERPDVYTAHPSSFSAGKFIAFERGELARRLEG